MQTTDTPTDYGPDSTDAAPVRWVPCDYPKCTRIYREGGECSSHGRTARAHDTLQALVLERHLLLSVTGGTTDPATLRRLASLDRRAAAVRGVIARGGIR